MKDRKELFCGTLDECSEWVGGQSNPEGLEIVRNTIGPEASVFYRRKIINRTIKTRVARETREVFKVKGLTSRPLVVSLDPGDLITFRPKGTRQSVTVPIGSLYHFARFTAARAIANARRKK